jgi:hypothetical protein
MVCLLIHLSMIAALDDSGFVLNTGQRVEIARNCATEKRNHIDDGLERGAENLQIP